MASLRGAQGNATGAEAFRELAENVARDTVQYLYVPGGNGTWGSLFPPDSRLVAVRHVIDFIYVSQGLGFASRVLDGAGAAAQEKKQQDGGPSPLLPPEVKQEMAAYFHREFETPTWLRALSPSDELNLPVPWPKSILRPDHGITGETRLHHQPFAIISQNQPNPPLTLQVRSTPGRRWRPRRWRSTTARGTGR